MTNMARGINQKRHMPTWAKKMLHSWQLYVLLLPALIWLILFMYEPM